MNTEEFNYVIARPWYNESYNNLCIYRIQNSDLHFGTMKEAKEVLAYVQKQNMKKQYHIYKVSYERIEDG